MLSNEAETELARKNKDTIQIPPPTAENEQRGLECMQGGLEHMQGRNVDCKEHWSILR